MDASISLDGTWSLAVDGTVLDFVEVPGSLPLMGNYTLTRRFPRPGGDRLFLCGDGLLCKGTFRLNGAELGIVGPWVPFRFEIDKRTLKDDNLLECDISDLGEKFGSTPGRRADGGIVRPLWLERRPETFVENFQLSYELDADLRLVKCEVVATLDGDASRAVEAVLSERVTGRVVAKGEGSAAAPLALAFDSLRLWSPDDPFLYTLTVRAGADELSDIVGFRKLETRGGDILLNGERLFLKGVCRHQFIHAFGYAPPEATTRRELALMKHFGFNFVRLVHSPHQREAARIAAELGLLVSEEPGLCWNDMDDPDIAAAGLATLEKVILRDRNCPSVAVWFLYNESEPKEDYIVKAAELCRRLDPGRLVSVADCSGKHDELLRLQEKAQLSFLGVNLYASDTDAYKKVLERLAGTPVVFTEWGGLVDQGNPRQLKLLCDFFAKRFHERSPDVAGCCFWAWADYEEYSRGAPASVDGWTVEGLVDRDGGIKPDLLALSKMFFDLDNPAPVYPPKVELLLKTPPRPGEWSVVDLEGVMTSGNAERQVVAARAHYQATTPKLSPAMLSGIPFHPRSAPLLLGADEEEFFIPVGRMVSSLAMLGHGAFIGGYPTNTSGFVFHLGHERDCAFGAPAAEYRFEFEGASEACPLRHGIDVLRANAMCRKWKSSPLSPKLALALRFTANPDFELHNVYLWEHLFAGPVFLKGVRWTLRDKASVQELFAVSVLLEE